MGSGWMLKRQLIEVTLSSEEENSTTHREVERWFQWKKTVTAAKFGQHKLMSLVICLEAMLQNIKPRNIRENLINCVNRHEGNCQELDYLSGAEKLRLINWERSFQKCSSNILLLYFTAPLIVICTLYGLLLQIVLLICFLIFMNLCIHQEIP